MRFETRQLVKAVAAGINNILVIGERPGDKLGNRSIIRNGRALLSLGNIYKLQDADYNNYGHVYLVDIYRNRTQKFWVLEVELVEPKASQVLVLSRPPAPTITTDNSCPQQPAPTASTNSQHQQPAPTASTNSQHHQQPAPTASTNSQHQQPQL